MGLGDPKLMICLGLVLGLAQGILAIVLAFWIGAIVGLFLLALSKLKLFGLHIGRKTELPFAPFLILGFFIAFLFGETILMHYGFML